MAQLDTQQTGTTICPPQGTWVIDPVHSTIEFSVRHLMAAKVRGHFTGDLTLHGVTRPVTIEAGYGGTVIDAFGTERFIAGARAAIDRTEFGLNWNQTLETGGLIVGKRIEVDIDIQAVRA